MSLTCFPHFAAPEGDHPLKDAPGEEDTEQRRVLLLREGPFKEIGRHPEVVPLLQEGWSLDSVYPLGPEKQKRRLLVLLCRPEDT